MRRVDAGYRPALLVTIVVYLIWQVDASSPDVELTHDGPVISGGIITFKAKLLDSDGNTPSGKFIYKWNDDAIVKHEYETESTKNTTSYFSTSYPAPTYPVGVYTMQVTICKYGFLNFYCEPYTSRRVYFHVTSLLNGNIVIKQLNSTSKNNFVSSSEVAKLSIDIRKGDLDYINRTATSISTIWVIDCTPYKTNSFTFNYNFTKPGTFHTIQALVIATYEPPTTTVAPTTTSTTLPTPTTMSTTTTTTPATTTTTTTTTIHPLITTSTTPTTTTTTTTTTTIHPLTTTVNVPSSSALITPNQTEILGYPFLCNSTTDPDANTTYGYFQKEVKIRAPISNLNIEGSTWIQSWKSLSLEITCNGSGPFRKCVEIHVGKYNITGNETCSENSEILETCKFSLEHYFLDRLEYTVLIILSNEVSNEVHPVAINIYKLTPKPQLSVIVVPVTCSLIALVAVIFGITYWVQSRSRFTVEVADFDFGQTSADMEYKTFTERLRDSFNNAVRPGNQRLLDDHLRNYGSMQFKST